MSIRINGLSSGLPPNLVDQVIEAVTAALEVERRENGLGGALEAAQAQGDSASLGRKARMLSVLGAAPARGQEHQVGQQKFHGRPPWQWPECATRRAALLRGAMSRATVSQAMPCRIARQTDADLRRRIPAPHARWPGAPKRPSPASKTQEIRAMRQILPGLNGPLTAAVAGLTPG